MKTDKPIKIYPLLIQLRDETKKPPVDVSIGIEFSKGKFKMFGKKYMDLACEVLLEKIISGLKGNKEIFPDGIIKSKALTK